MKFIDNARFMASSLSNLNLAEGIHKIKREDCYYFLKYKSVKDNLIKYKGLFYKKDYSNKVDDELKSYLRAHLTFLRMISKSLFSF